MPGPRRYHKKKPGRRQALAPIAEESAAATREEFPALTSREERLAGRLARQKDFIANPGSSATVGEFQRTLSSTKSAMTQLEADLGKLRRLSESGRATDPAQAVQETPPAPPNPTPEIATAFPLIPITIPIPAPSVVQQIQRAVSGGWIPYYSVAPSGDSTGAAAQIIPHLYFPWPAPPPPGELGAEDEGGADGHYYYPYFALPVWGR